LNAFSNRRLRDGLKQDLESKMPKKRIKATDVAPIVDRIKPLLAGHDPSLQGAILGDLVAMFLAGHPPGIREEIFQMHIDLVRQLTEVNEKIMFGDAGHPSGGLKQGTWRAINE
jgi:hypothetical protein